MVRRLWIELGHKIWPEGLRFLFTLEQFSPPGAKECIPTPNFHILEPPQNTKFLRFKGEVK